MRATESHDPFRLLFVCTGNICRSPAAEALAGHLLRERSSLRGGPIEVMSAGTQARPSEPMATGMVTALDEVGVRPAPSLSVRLSPALIRAGDLILTMEMAHRAVILAEHPHALARTFTLLEFARLTAESTPAYTLAGADPVTRIRSLAAAARTARGRTALPASGCDDIADPYGGTIQDHRDCVALIWRGLKCFLTGLSPNPPAENLQADLVRPVWAP